MRDTWELRNACSRQETQYFGLEFPMILGKLWRNVEFVKQVPEQPNHWKCE